MIFRAGQFLVGVLLWSIGGAAILAFFTFGLGLLLGPWVGIPTPVLGLFLMLMLARLMNRTRTRRGFTVVGYLEQAARLNLPLPEMLAAAERSETGTTHRRLANLRTALLSGATVGDALEATCPEVKHADRRQIEAGERIGRLAPTLTRVHRRALSKLRRQGSETEAVFGFSYGAVVLSIMLLLFGLVTYLIVPKYIEIFDDFGTTLPWLSRVTFTVTASLGIWPMVAGAAAVMLLVGWSMASMVQQREVQWKRLPLIDDLLSLLPLVGRVERDRALSSAFAAAGEALDAGWDLPDALRLAAEAATTRRMRSRLVGLSDRLEAGVSMSDALVRSGIPPLARGLLGAVDRGGDAAATFRFLASHHGERAHRLWRVACATVVPGIVVILAVLVGWMTLSLFLPLISLITEVNQWTVI